MRLRQLKEYKKGESAVRFRLCDSFEFVGYLCEYVRTTVYNVVSDVGGSYPLYRVFDYFLYIKIVK